MKTFMRFMCALLITWVIIILLTLLIPMHPGMAVIVGYAVGSTVVFLMLEWILDL